jgi:hypothetical protein
VARGPLEVSLGLDRAKVEGARRADEEEDEGALRSAKAEEAT